MALLYNVNENIVSHQTCLNEKNLLILTNKFNITFWINRHKIGFDKTAFCALSVVKVS